MDPEWRSYNTIIIKEKISTQNYSTVTFTAMPIGGPNTGCNPTMFKAKYSSALADGGICFFDSEGLATGLPKREKGWSFWPQPGSDACLGTKF